MTNHTEPLFEEKLAFVSTALEAQEKRRDSLENKSAILLASNAIVLGAVVGFGIPSLPITGFAWISALITALCLICTIASTIYAVAILAPVKNLGGRHQIMDIHREDDEGNLIFFKRIAEMDKVEYLAKINDLNESEILKQLTSDTHNLARLLRNRYETLHRSYIAFFLSLLAFVALAFTMVFQ